MVIFPGASSMPIIYHQTLDMGRKSSRVQSTRANLHVLMSLMKGEFKAPDFSRDYSATLHINIDEYFRGQGIGSKLINNYLKYLRGQCITGVHFATMSDKTSNFFVKQGFNLLFRSKRSYFRYILHKDTPIYIYGRKL